jgi:hypothetical protein
MARIGPRFTRLKEAALVIAKTLSICKGKVGKATSIKSAAHPTLMLCGMSWAWPMQAQPMKDKRRQSSMLPALLLWLWLVEVGLLACLRLWRLSVAQ